MIKKIIKITKKPDNLITVTPGENKEQKQTIQNIQEQQISSKVSPDQKNNLHSEQIPLKNKQEFKQKYNDSADKLNITKLNPELQKKKTINTMQDDLKHDKQGRTRQSQRDLSYREKQPFKKIKISLPQENQSPLKKTEKQYEKTKDLEVQQSQQIKQIEATINKKTTDSTNNRQKTSLVDRDFEGLTKLNEKRLSSKIQPSSLTPKIQSLQNQFKQVKKSPNDNEIGSKVQSTSNEQQNNQNENTSSQTQKLLKKLILKRPDSQLLKLSASEVSQTDNEKSLTILHIKLSPQKQNQNNQIQESQHLKELKLAQFTPTPLKKEVKNIQISPIIAETMDQLFEENSNEEIQGSFAKGHQALSVSIADYYKDQYLVEWRNIQSKQLDSHRITPKSTIYKLSQVKKCAPDLYMKFLENQYSQFQTILWEKQKEENELMNKKRLIEKESEIQSVIEVPLVTECEKEQPIEVDKFQVLPENSINIEPIQNDEEEKILEEIKPSCFNCDKQVFDIANNEQEEIVFNVQESKSNKQKSIDVNLCDNQLEKEIKLIKQNLSVEFSSQNNESVLEDKQNERKTKSVEVHSLENLKYNQKKDEIKIFETNCEKETQKINDDPTPKQNEQNLIQNEEQSSNISSCQIITEKQDLSPNKNDIQINNNLPQAILEEEVVEEEKENRIQENVQQQIVEVMEIEDNNETVNEIANEITTVNQDINNEKIIQTERNIEIQQVSTLDSNLEKNNDFQKEEQPIQINLDNPQDVNPIGLLSSITIVNETCDNSCQDANVQILTSEAIVLEEEYKCKEGDNLFNKATVESLSDVKEILSDVKESLSDEKEKVVEGAINTILEVIPEAINDQESDQKVQATVTRDTITVIDDQNINSQNYLSQNEFREDSKEQSSEQNNTVIIDNTSLNNHTKINISKHLFRQNTTFQGARKTAPSYPEKNSQHSSSSKKDTSNEEFDRQQYLSRLNEEDQLDYFKENSDDSQQQSPHQQIVSKKPELLIGSLIRLKNKVENSINGILVKETS